MSYTIVYLVGAIVALVFGFRAFTVSHGSQNTITGRDILAVFLIVLGIAGALLGLQSFQYEVAGSGGSPALYRCPDLTNILCYGPGSSGAETINGTEWLNVQHGTTTCTMSISLTCIASLITFTTPYSTTPFAFAFGNASSNSFPVLPATTLSSTTTTTFKELVFQADNATTWKNMPASDTPVELYGQTNQKLDFTIPTGATNVQLGFCVNVVQPSQNGTATLTVQFGTTDTQSSSGRLSTVVGVTGFQCFNGGFGTFTANSNFPIGSTQTLRVVGRDGTASVFCAPTCTANCNPNNNAGFGVSPDCPVFGSIEFLVRYDIVTSITGPDACVPFIYTVTATTIRPGERCQALVSSATTFNLNWWAAVPA
jgi:hypothetical protein